MTARLRQAVRLLMRAITALAIGLTVLAGLAVWRLSDGPIDLDFLKSYARSSFDTREGKVTLEAGRVRVAWEGWQQPPRLILSQIEVRNAQGVSLASVPEVDIGLSLRALAAGALAPTRIAIRTVRLDVVVRADGLIDVVLPQASPDSSAGVMPLLVEQLLRESNSNHPLGRLQEVVIESASLKVDDRTSGFVWDAPAGRAVMLRDSDGVRITGALTVEASGRRSEVGLVALYGRDRRQFEAVLTGRDLWPSAYASAAPQLAPLRQLDLPMSGTIRVKADGELRIRNVAIDLAGGRGTVGIPGLWSTPRPVDDARLRIGFDPAVGVLRVEEFSVSMGGPVLSLTGAVAIDGKRFRADAEAKLGKVPIARLGDFWPAGMADGGRRWALENVVEGELESAVAKVEVSGSFDQPDAVELTKAFAELRYRDMTIHYLKPLPPIRGASGVARFDGKAFRFQIDGGNAEALRLGPSRFDILGLDGPTQRAEATAEILTSGAEALRFLGQPRIGINKDLLFDPRRVSGDVAMTLQLGFPLLADLALKDLVYEGTAKVQRFGLKSVVGGLDLTDATATLDVNPRELKVSGRGKADGHVVDVAWHEQFAARAAFRRRYDVKGRLPVPSIVKAGVPIPDWMRVAGPVRLDLTYGTPIAGPSELRARLDLTAATLGVPLVRWQKAAGIEAAATVVSRFAGGPAPATTDFDIKTVDLYATGRLDLKAATGDFEKVTLARLRLGASDVIGTMQGAGPGRYRIDVRGAVIELARFLPEDVPKAPPGKAAVPTPTAAPPKTGPVLSIAVDVGRVLLKRGALPAVSGTLALVGDRVTAASLRASASAAGPSTLAILPAGKGRSVALASPDIGSLLSAAGWLDGVRGGALKVEGQSDDSGAEAIFDGRVSAHGFQLATVPTNPAREVPNLNGTVGQLARAGGDGQVFERFELRVQKQGDRLSMRDGRTNGSQVGLLAHGTYALDTDEICLAGSIVPAYALNSVISNIPLLGDLLTGGRGSGLFALNFLVKGPIGDPSASVNPLSALPIGPLRNLMMTGCGLASGADTPQGPPAGSQAERDQRIGG